MLVLAQYFTRRIEPMNGSARGLTPPSLQPPSIPLGAYTLEATTFINRVLNTILYVFQKLKETSL